ncbi:hypothetical protein [Nostoc sp. UIC 10630]|uniref:hypothetical protein n=1 Tax=Nostoc sp. UIC 10630 TaxID=2100146 RepID=UPI0013D86088|nr:hypothetical protein [Nostoc sp. UIC 10630]NEU82515.1 hypothetical protein [Nostoc sp. UIC 10630]
MTKFTHLLTNRFDNGRSHYSDRLTENLGASRAIAFTNRTLCKTKRCRGKALSRRVSPLSEN